MQLFLPCTWISNCNWIVWAAPVINIYFEWKKYPERGQCVLLVGASSHVRDSIWRNLLCCNDYHFSYPDNSSEVCSSTRHFMNDFVFFHENCAIILFSSRRKVTLLRLPFYVSVCLSVHLYIYLFLFVPLPSNQSVIFMKFSRKVMSLKITSTLEFQCLSFKYSKMPDFQTYEVIKIEPVNAWLRLLLAEQLLMRQFFVENQKHERGGRFK